MVRVSGGADGGGERLVVDGVKQPAEQRGLGASGGEESYAKLHLEHRHSEVRKAGHPECAWTRGGAVGGRWKGCVEKATTVDVERVHSARDELCVEGSHSGECAGASRAAVQAGRVAKAVARAVRYRTKAVAPQAVHVLQTVRMWLVAVVLGSVRAVVLAALTRSLPRAHVSRVMIVNLLALILILTTRRRCQSRSRAWPNFQAPAT